MVLQLRQATPADESAVSRICFLTANAGKTAEGLFKNPELPGLVYAVPYLHLASCWKYVLVNNVEGQQEEIVGYVLGASDCRAFEADAAENWWPKVQQRYPKPPESEKSKYTEAEWYYFETIANPHTTGQEIVDVYPAFLHINILPPHQGQGWGTRMIRKAAEQVTSDGAKGLWVGIDKRNDDARQFYKALGFFFIQSKEGECYGLDAKKFLDSDRGRWPAAV
jgi:ribosomal protein S18 acetylase RimI-like enzyme